MELRIACVLDDDREEVLDINTAYINTLLYGHAIPVIIRKKDFLESGGFSENMKHGAEDWDFFIRFLWKDQLSAASGDEPLYYYRKPVSNQSLSKSAGERLDSIKKEIFVNNIDLFSEYFGNPIDVYRRLESYKWADRRLPQFTHKVQIFYQKILEFIRG